MSPPRLPRPQPQFNRSRRGGSGGGQSKLFFSGLLGLAVIPILSLMVAAVLFAMYGKMTGLITFFSVLGSLIAWKAAEANIAKQTSLQ